MSRDEVRDEDRLQQQKSIGKSIAETPIILLIFAKLSVSVSLILSTGSIHIDIGDYICK